MLRNAWGRYFPASVFNWSLVAIVATAVCVFFLGLGRCRLWDQDEGFFATAAAEMYQHNDWIVPTFNGEMFGHKPPLMYWGMMAGYRLFGVNEFGARIASAFFGLATALATWQLGRRLFDETTGLLAGIIIASSMMFSVVARAATPDAHLTFFAVLAFLFWSRDAFPKPQENGPRGIRWQTWLATYIATAAGVLAKGPIGIFFPMAVIGLYYLIQTPLRKVTENSSLLARIGTQLEPFGPVNFLRTTWQMRPFLAIAMLLAVAGPWYLLVGWQTNGEFLREFFGKHHFGRFTTSMDNHSGPWFYYVLACLAGMFPWSFFAYPTLLLWWQRLRRESSPQFWFVVCWAAVYLVIFSLARTKLPNYVLPAYPALALMLAHYFATWLRAKEDLSLFWLRGGQGVALFVGAVLLFGFPAAGSLQFGGGTLLDRFQVAPELQRETFTLGLAGLPLLLGGAVVIVCSEWRQERFAVMTFAVTAVVTLTVLWNDTVPRIDRFQSPQILAAKLRPVPGEKFSVAALKFFRPTMIFYFGQPITQFRDDQAAIYALEEEPALYLITTSDHYDRLKSQLPADVEVVERQPKFPTKGEIVVLARAATIAARERPAQR